MKKKIVVALAAAVLMSQAVKSEPQVLTAAQMDEVTARGVFVDVLSLASAQGDFAKAFTYALTHIVTTPWAAWGFGVSIGRAVACCGPDAEVEVASEGIGEGDRVLVRRHSGERQSPGFAYAVSVVTVVVSSRATPAEVRAGLAGHGSFSGGAKMVEFSSM